MTSLLALAADAAGQLGFCHGSSLLLTHSRLCITLLLLVELRLSLIMLLSPLASQSSVTSNILIVTSLTTISRRAGKSPKVVYLGSLRRWVNLQNEMDRY